MSLFEHQTVENALLINRLDTEEVPLSARLTWTVIAG